MNPASINIAGVTKWYRARRHNDASILEVHLASYLLLDPVQRVVVILNLYLSRLHLVGKHMLTQLRQNNKNEGGKKISADLSEVIGVST